ncbi:MAG: VPLPA-CTERM sorting domain-containing protein [Pseudooceanicola sp.]
MKYFNVLAAAAVGLAAMAGSAYAATCNYVNRYDANDTFETTLTPAVSCYAFGAININGNPDKDPILANGDIDGNWIDFVGPSIANLKLIDQGYSFSNSEEDGKDGKALSEISIAQSEISGWTDLVLGVKFGNQYVAFNLVEANFPDPTSIFNFTADPKQQAGVSHVVLYGRMTEVPVPAAGLLLVGALGAFGVARRRKV